MPNLRIHFEDDEFEAVQALAKKELRNFDGEVRYLIRQELQRLGYLPPTPENPESLSFTNVESPGE
jgi:hypothetical protein